MGIIYSQLFQYKLHIETDIYYVVYVVLESYI